MNKAYRKIEQFLIENGFEYSHTLSKQRDVFVAAGHSDFTLNQNIDDHRSKLLLRNLQKRFGIATDKDHRKRDAGAIRDRQAKERERLQQELARSNRELEALVRQREERLDGLGRVLDSEAMHAIERHIEAKEAELREWNRLIREIPSAAENRGTGQVRHRAGQVTP